MFPRLRVDRSFMTGGWALTTLEEYFLLEDRPSYPWSFFLRLGFRGEADRQAVELAFARAVARHPLLRAIACQQPGGWRWLVRDETQAAVHWNTNAIDGQDFTATYLDVTKEIGVRLYVDVKTDSSQLIFQFHHACCDARGALGLIDDWLVEYARATGVQQQIPPLPDVDPDVLEQRGHFKANNRQTASTWTVLVAGVKRAYRFLRQQPAPLLDFEPAGNSEATPSDFPAVRTFHFEPMITDQLRQVAKSEGGTLNDLLCRDLLMALCRFRDEVRSSSSNAWLRLAVATDLRTADQQPMPATNQSSMVFVTRCENECRVAEPLFQGIHRELQQVKDWGLGRTFLRSLQIGQRLPGGLARRVRQKKCGATAALTNVGQVLRDSRVPCVGDNLVAGNLQLETVDFLAPIRPLTAASFSVCTYAGCLSICLQYDRRALNEPAADQLMETYRDQLRSHLEETIDRRPAT
ncbi:MAG: hypothetical protein EA424_12745 [Planctomycetaceae bacterium]|nr:MAG: hypothetical protein EA424_12745 [Planctomycetaceae bacterium]